MTSPARAPRPTPRRTLLVDPAPSDGRRRDHLRVVPEPRRTGRAAPRVRAGLGAPVLVVAVALVFGSLLTSAVFHGLLVGGQTQLDQLEEQLATEQVALAREELALAQLSSPEHIAREAAALGMVRADEQIWLSPGAGGTPVVTGGPAPDTTASSSELAGAPTEAEAP